MLVGPSGVQTKTQGVSLADTKEFRLSFGLEQKREITTFYKRTDQLRALTQERIVVNVE